MVTKNKPIMNNLKLPRPTGIDLVVLGIYLLVFSGTIVFSLSGSFGEPTRLVVESSGKTWEYGLDHDVDIEIPGPLGPSRIQIVDGQAQFTDSPCKDKLCVHAGSIHSPNAWAACLPNKVMIRITSSKELPEDLPDASAF